MTNNVAGFPLLTLLIFLPALAGILLPIVPRAQTMTLKLIALAVALTSH